MKSIAFAPLHDSPGKADAREFTHQAHEFLAAHNQPNGVRLFDNVMPPQKRFSQTLDWLSQTLPGIDTFAWFCHGTKHGAQFGATLQNAGRLAAAIKRISVTEPVIALYACSTGADNDADVTDETEPGPGGEGGMADALRDALVKAGVGATIYAHSTVGHTATNPYVRRFSPEQAAGGSWIVAPHTELWHAWVKALQGGLRFRYPFLTQAEIEAELRASAGLVA